MSDLTPLEAAETLEDIAAVSDLKAVDGIRSGLVNLPKNDASSLRVIASYLRQISAGEYKPVVHAHWIEFGAEDYECSNCLTTAIRKGKYCDNCGAQMNGKDNNHE